MENVFDLLPDALLTIMGLLSLIRIKRFRDAFAATAAVFGMDEGQLYREVELYVQEHWEEEFAALDVHSRGLQYFVCRLTHCGVRDREFETVAAWKKHVALSKSHLEDAFCGSCGHHLIVPPEVGPANVKAFIIAHKKERCVGASKATMRQRQAEVTWLGGLMRNTSHILVPG
uniref:Mut7-C domain-containing protein n=1 Tax=Ascaris lumbricoides TaxID=6252 RepID=A0A0M3IEA5_ASCLU